MSALLTASLESAMLSVDFLDFLGSRDVAGMVGIQADGQGCPDDLADSEANRT